MFPYLTKTLTLAFSQTLFSEVFQILHDYNLALRMPICTRFNDRF